VRSTINAKVDSPMKYYSVDDSRAKLIVDDIFNNLHKKIYSSGYSLHTSSPGHYHTSSPGHYHSNVTFDAGKSHHYVIDSGISPL